MVDIVYYVMGVGLVAYVLTAGADFGGGFWHLLARGPRAREARATIEHAIAPIWEANHVWLIFVIVMMFTAYPKAFAVVSIAFHVPIAIALVGIVLRGAAFVFKAYGLGPSPARERWGRVFAGASALTPIFLGLVLAGTSSGAVTLEGERVTSGFFAGWTTSFAWLTGLFTLALFALLAAVYLAVEAKGEVREDFRRRAIVLELIAGALALAVFVAARRDAPMLVARFSNAAVFWPVQIATALAAIGVVATMWQRRWRIARVLAATQVALVVLGWGVAMNGELVMGAVSRANAGGRGETIRAVLPALAVGSLLLVPALVYLFRLFKSRPPASD